MIFFSFVEKIVIESTILMDPRETGMYGRTGAKIFELHRRVNLPVIEKIIPYIHGDNYLDAGCGVGNDLTEILKRTGYKGFGCDASPDMLEIARKRNCAQELCVADLDTEFPFDRVFSVIYTMDVLHHLKNPEVFIGNAYTHLQSRDHLLIGDETEEDLRLKIKSTYFPGALEIDLARYHAPSKLEKITRAAGFQSTTEIKVRQQVDVTEDYIDQFRRKAHSVLMLLDEESYETGMRKLEEDFSSGRLPTRTLSYTILDITK